MTGTDPADHREKQGLARSLFRVSLPRWRGGRYSLSKLFFNFYLLAMGSFVAIAFFADLVISTAVKGITDDYTQRFMRGTIVLIEDELFRKPRSEWPKTIKAMDNKFAYRLDIVPRWTLKLPPKQANKLDAGELVIDADGDILYHRLKQTPEIGFDHLLADATALLARRQIQRQRRLQRGLLLPVAGIPCRLCPIPTGSVG